MALWTLIRIILNQEKHRKSFEYPHNYLYFSELLHKPVLRIQRNCLVLQDLVQWTPLKHPDRPVLESALKLSIHNIENLIDPTSDSNNEVCIAVKYAHMPRCQDVTFSVLLDGQCHLGFHACSIFHASKNNFHSMQQRPDGVITHHLA
jgi:hypothetical protein